MEINLKDKISSVGKILNDSNQPLKERFRALFTLRNIGGLESIECISQCFKDPSALLKHELAYCLGQMQDKNAMPFLIDVLKDFSQEPMVRHEAAEAIGAIGDVGSIDILKEYTKDLVQEVAETCHLALRRILSLESCHDTVSPYKTVDPTPSMKENNIIKLKSVLLDDKEDLFNRYKAMFTLRNLKTEESILALCEGLFVGSSLFRHEVAFVLGQIQSELSIKSLEKSLRDINENEMVRHEAAEALGSIATNECVEILKEFLKDRSRVVSESCLIALDMADYENSNDFQYANTVTVNFRYNMDEEDIDIEMLISLIECRPVLWDKTISQYKNKISTKNAWMEICETICPNFLDMVDEERNKFGKEVIKRWANIRDSYLKSRKKIKEASKSGAGSSHLKKYVYSDQLQFLQKVSEERPTEDSLADVPEDPPGDFHSSITKQCQRTKNSGAKKKIDPVEERILKAIETPYQENRHISFIKGVIPSLNAFNENEIIQFQMGILELISNIKKQKNSSTCMAAMPTSTKYTSTPRSYRKVSNNDHPGISHHFLLENINDSSYLTLDQPGTSSHQPDSQNYVTYEVHTLSSEDISDSTSSIDFA